MARLNNSITDENERLKKKAKELSKQSPDITKLVGYKLDEKTTIYFKPGISQAKIKKKLELYKKSLTHASESFLITFGD